MLNIYQLRVVLRGVSPLIWRRLLVRSDTTIAELHAVLQAVMDWSDSHLHRFRVHGKAYGIARFGGIDFADDPSRVGLCDFRLRCGERFVYEYNFIDGWVLDVRLEQTLTHDTRRVYPRCTAGRRAAPPEDCGGPRAYLANLEQYPLRRFEAVESLAEALEPLLTSRSGLDMDDDVLLDAFESVEECLRFRPDRFDRKTLDAELRGLARCCGGAA